MNPRDAGHGALILVSLLAVLAVLALVVAPVVRDLSHNVHHITTTTEEQ